MGTQWQHILASYSGSGIPEELACLKREEGQFLLDRLEKLPAFKELKGLYSLEREQEQLGAGFYGVLSSPLPEVHAFELEENEEDFLKAVSLLSGAKQKAQEEIREKMPYTLTFKGEKPSLPHVQDHYSGTITLQTEGIKTLLTCMEQGDSSGISRLVENEAFAEMLTHRKNLGYIPDPIIDAKGLETMFIRGVSRKPLDEIWKWVNVQNFFDTGDYYLNQKAYRETISTLELQWHAFEQTILAVIDQFAPKGFVFFDCLSLGVGWGIRGWATEKTAGINLEHVKDDYQLFLACAIHELFHRFQVAVCPRGEGQGFEAILKGSKKLDHPHRLFHKVLAYIYLEGTAEYACNLISEPEEQILKDVQKGLDLLEEIFAKIGTKDEEEIDTLINQGLISNGPFYSLGEYMCRRIKEENPGRLRDVFLAGAPTFFNQFFALNTQLRVGQALKNKIHDIERIM